MARNNDHSIEILTIHTVFLKDKTHFLVAWINASCHLSLSFDYKLMQNELKQPLLQPHLPHSLLFSSYLVLKLYAKSIMDMKQSVSSFGVGSGLRGVSLFLHEIVAFILRPAH